MSNNGLLLCSVCWWVFQQGQLLLEATNVLSYQGCKALPCRRAEPCQGAQGLSCSRYHLSHPVIPQLQTDTHRNNSHDAVLVTDEVGTSRTAAQALSNLPRGFGIQQQPVRAT